MSDFTFANLTKAKSNFVISKLSLIEKYQFLASIINLKKVIMGTAEHSPSG